MSRGTHSSPQRSRFHKRKKSQKKSAALVASNISLLKSLQNG
jgi:hypothetical protein